MSVTDTLSKSDVHKDWIKSLRTREVNEFGFAALDDMFGRTDLQPGASVLDAGCGTGTNSRWFAERGFSVTGADFSDFALEQARAVSPGIDYRREDLTSLSFPDASFDAVACIGVLMHIPDVEKALGELVRVLKPGGWLVISEANAWAPETYLFRAYWRLRRRNIKVVRKPCGLEVWAQTSAGPLLSRKASARWLMRLLREQGMKRIRRATGELTEVYLYTSNKNIRRALHGLNRMWFRIGGPPWAAASSCFLFSKAE